MIWPIAWKEFLLNLRSSRFWVGFVICLVIIPFTMTISVDEYRQQTENCRLEEINARQTMDSCLVWSAVRPTVIRYPETLSLFSRGISGELDISLPIWIKSVPSVSSLHFLPSSLFLSAFPTLDFANVLSMIVSLLALVFSYDAITREREEGTLRLVFSSSISRTYFILGKLLGVVITLLPVILFCFLLALGIICLEASISFSAADWGGLMGMGALSVLYLLLFASLGLLISSLTYKSVTSIILCMLSWMTGVFIIPPLSSFLACYGRPVPAYEQIQQEINRMDSEMDHKRYATWLAIRDSLQVPSIRYIYLEERKDLGIEIRGGSRSILEHTRQFMIHMIPLYLDFADRVWQLDRAYQESLCRQLELQHLLCVCSPSSLFRQSMDAISCTDADYIMDYMEEVRCYRLEFIRFLTDRNLIAHIRYVTPDNESDFIPDDEYVPIEDEIVSKSAQKGVAADSLMDYYHKKILLKAYPYLDTHKVPSFSPTRFTGWQRFGRASSRILLLSVLTILCLGGALLAFRRYDLR